jgi:hypothetical protein
MKGKTEYLYELYSTSPSSIQVLIYFRVLIANGIAGLNTRRLQLHVELLHEDVH